MYGPDVMSTQMVQRWCQQFRDGRTSVLDDATGRPAMAMGDENITGQVEELIQWGRHVTVDNVAMEVGIGHAPAHKLIHDILEYRNISLQWMPRQLTPDHKAQQMGTSLQHLLCYKMDGNAFLFRIVTGDESWVHHFTPESKAASVAWKHTTSPVRKKFKTTPSAGKVHLTVFWDAEGVLLLNFLE
jgi:hypothetical protein